MEAATTPATEAKTPLEEHTALELWREIRRIADNVYLTQELAVTKIELEKSGVEMGEKHLRISVAGNLDGGKVKMIQAAATGAGREVVLESGTLRIY